jgi:hypothetical protein
MVLLCFDVCLQSQNVPEKLKEDSLHAKDVYKQDLVNLSSCETPQSGCRKYSEFRHLLETYPVSGR